MCFSSSRPVALFVSLKALIHVVFFFNLQDPSRFREDLHFEQPVVGSHNENFIDQHAMLQLHIDMNDLARHAGQRNSWACCMETLCLVTRPGT